MPTMTAVPPTDIQQNTETTKIVCHYCKKTRPRYPRLSKNMIKEHEQRNGPSIQNKKPSKSESFASCPYCQ